MVADKIDMSLDDIIATNRRGRGGRGGRGARGGRGSFRGGRGGPRGRSQNFRSGGGPMTRRGGRGFNQNRTSPYSRPRNIPDKWEHDKYDGPGRGVNGGPGGRRSGGEGVTTGAHLQIANLDFGVTESDIKELFSEFGKLKKAIINYDGSGRSHGTADVIFEKRADASKAVKTYNGVPLDGRPMKIEVVSGQISLEQQQQQNNSTPMRRRLSGGNTRGGNNYNSSRGRGRGDNFRGYRGGRGRGGNRGGRRDQRDVPSKDELDKELDSYVVKGNL